MDLTLYGLKNCDTCRKALKALSSAGHTVTYIDVRADGVDTDKLAEFHTTFGDALTNTRSTTWRGLSDAERQTPALQLLQTHPTLMKRPVIEGADAPTLGWGKDIPALYGL